MARPWRRFPCNHRSASRPRPACAASLVATNQHASLPMTTNLPRSTRRIPRGRMPTSTPVLQSLILITIITQHNPTCRYRQISVTHRRPRSRRLPSSPRPRLQLSCLRETSFPRPNRRRRSQARRISRQPGIWDGSHRLYSKLTRKPSSIAPFQLRHCQPTQSCVRMLLSAVAGRARMRPLVPCHSKKKTHAKRLQLGRRRRTRRGSICGHCRRQLAKRTGFRRFTL